MVGILKTSTNPNVTAARDALIRRLRLIIPFYSIEAWLYQCSDVALDVCFRHYKCQDRPQIEAWREDRAILDEVFKPAEATCMRRSHNLELAEGFTNQIAAELIRAEKSFSAFASDLAGTIEFASLLPRQDPESIN